MLKVRIKAGSFEYGMWLLINKVADEMIAREAQKAAEDLIWGGYSVSQTSELGVKCMNPSLMFVKRTPVVPVVPDFGLKRTADLQLEVNSIQSVLSNIVNEQSR